MIRLWLAWDWDGECILFIGPRPVLSDGVWASCHRDSVPYYIGELDSRDRAEQCVELVAKENEQ